MVQAVRKSCLNKGMHAKTNKVTALALKENITLF